MEVEVGLEGEVEVGLRIKVEVGEEVESKVEVEELVEEFREEVVKVSEAVEFEISKFKGSKSKVEVVEVRWRSEKGGLKEVEVLKVEVVELGVEIWLELRRFKEVVERSRVVEDKS